MNKIIRTLLLMALVLPWAATAQNTLTVADGTATNSNVPVYGLWADAYLRCQTIYPASDIAVATTTVAMNGGSITGLTYYITSPAAEAWTGTFEVKMMETTSTTLSAFADMTGATTVYTGALNGTGSTMTVTFATPYTYNGGNLLIEVSQTTPGNWKSCTFSGVSASGASWQGYNSGSFSGITGSAQNFIPKTTFTFTGGQAVTCPPIQAIALGAIDSNSAVINWVDTMNSGASYTVTYWPQNATANDTMTETSQTTTVTLTGLNANTRYQYTIQVNCSASDNSVALGGSFRTACGTITLPYFVDFEDAAHNGAWYPCWDSTIHAGTDPSVNSENSPANHTAGGAYAMYLQSNSSENYNLVVSPAVPLPGDQIYVNFWARVSSSAWLKAGVMTNPHDTTTFIPLVEVSGNSWNEYNFSTSALDPTATYYVAWLGYRNSGFIGKFDDVTISEIPSCLRVTSVAVDSVSSESITVSWVDTINSGATYTVICIGPNDTMEYNGISDQSYTIDYLSANTPYTISVVVNCSGDDAEAVTVSTRTSCAAMTIPFAEGFEDAGSLSCWKMVDCVSSTGRTTSNANTGNACFRFYYGYNPQYLISPEIDGTEDGVKVEFAYKQGTSYTETFKVGYSTTNDSVNSFVWSNEYTATSTYQTFSGTYPSGTKYVAIQLTSYDQLYLYIDDINFMLPPACMPVAGLAASDITSDGATISWASDATQSNWIVRVGNTDYNASDTSYTLTGLDARTSYTVYVATDCGGDTSEWQSVTFTTDCAGGSCDITVDMTDSYGDGWNGASISFSQNGTVVGTASLSGGNSGTATVSVCSGAPVAFSWNTGSYDYETGYVIYDGGGSEVYNSATSGVNHSDIIPDACPTCMRPTGLVATVIDSTELGFSWDYSDTVSGYLVSFNGGPWTTYTGTLPYMENNLTPNTAYTFGVMAICSAADTSVATTITVKTACGGMTLPYSEDFEAETVNEVPSCWTVVREGYDGYPAISGSSAYAHGGSKYLSLAANYNDSTTIATNLVPLNGDQIQVSFWASVNSGNTIKAGVMTSLAYDSTFIPLLTIPANNSTYTRYEFNTSTLSPYDQYYVAFRLVTGGSNHYTDIDDINIFQNQGCSYPANITANPGAHNIALVWSCAATTPNFVVEYHSNDSTAWTNAGSTIDTSYDITGLNAATMYQIRIGLICNNDTLWSYVSSQTTCDLLPLPYFENFDSYAEHVLPPCWSIAIPGTSLSSNSGVTHYDGGLFFRSNNGGGANYAVLPQLDGNITKLQIEFDCKVGSIAEQDGILFGVADAAGVLIAWLDTIQDPNHSRNAHVHHILNMLNRTVPSGAARIAFAQYRSWNEWALIDNINIVSLPDCYPVDSLQAHNLIDPDHTSFTWASLGEEAAWQVYVDTVTVDIDSVPDSLFVDVYTRSYEIPMGTIQGGGIYTFYVRANCSTDQSNWNSVTFGAGSYVMNNSTVADTIVACGLVVYDNGGAIAGYVGNSNSSLVIRAENVGSQLQIFGGKFGFGASPATLTVYDGEGTTGTVLYTYNQLNTNNDVYDSILATTSTGAMTITFTVSGEMCHTGYELYIHCVGAALCERPTQLNAVMTGAGQADVSWSGSSASYDLYYKLTGATNWTVQSGITGTTTTLTGLVTDTTYDMQVVGICGSDTSTPSFPIVLNTEYNVVITPCDPVTDVAVTDVTSNSATVSWTSTGDTWVISYKHLTVTDTITVTTNPYTLTGLLANMDYTVKVRNVCSGANQDPVSEWSSAVNFHTPNASPTSFTITVASNNDDWGTVDGGGTYAAGSTATLTANPNTGYRFVRWNDNNTDNPRHVVVNADATYTAYFEASNGIADVDCGSLTLSPNPASSTVTLGIEGFSGVVNVEIVDMNGKACGKWTVTSGQLTVDLGGYAQGAYFVRVTGERQTAVRKLIVR